MYRLLGWQRTPRTKNPHSNGGIRAKRSVPRLWYAETRPCQKGTQSTRTGTLPAGRPTDHQEEYRLALIRPCRPASRSSLSRTILALLLSLPLSTRAASVWVTNSSEKVRPGASARTLSPAVLSAAKNEFEAFQVAVTADAGAVSGATMTATALTGPQTIPAPRLFREAIITLAQPSSNDGATGDFPDAMVPDVDD